MPIVPRFGGGATTVLPTFTYLKDDGVTPASYLLINDAPRGWRIKCLESGTLKFSGNVTIDLFIVGGGAGGAGGGGTASGGGAGGGGYTNSISSLVAQTGVGYPIVVGAGGNAGAPTADGSNGGTSTAFTYQAIGGYKGTYVNYTGGNGGSGGGSGTTTGVTAGVGGTDGSNGTGTSPGTGQTTTTKEFAESGGTLYSTGGDGGKTAPVTKLANTGFGGDAGKAAGVSGSKGASGIVVIRNHRAA